MKNAPRVQSDPKVEADLHMYAGDLFGEFRLSSETGEQRRLFPLLFPGIAACVTAAAAAAWLAEHYEFPVILLGLLIGALLNFLGDDRKVQPGLNFSARQPLKLAIVLLGFQVSVDQVLALGALPFFELIAIMAASIMAAVLTSRLLKQPLEVGLLAGCATAICGLSAAVALFAPMDRKRVSDAHFAVTLAGISLASAVAMSVYPVIGRELGLGDREAGFLIGATIHDVAQAIGGGYAFSDEAGRYATIVKLTRVALLGPAVLLVGLLLKGRNGSSDKGPRYALPGFLLAFVVVAVLGSWLPVPDDLRSGALTASKALLVISVTATAMRTRLNMLGQIGFGGVAPVLAATLASLSVGLALTLLQMS